MPNGELWRQLWRDVEACSGVKGSYAAVSWYVVPGGSSFLWQGQEVAGLWTSSGNRIVLAELSVARYDVVRHEMLHAVLEVDGHPAEYFVERCGAWIT